MLIFQEDIVFKGYTCIIPSLGVGNVSQLSTDLIISTLKLRQVATGFHEVNTFLPQKKYKYFLLKNKNVFF